MTGETISWMGIEAGIAFLATGCLFMTTYAAFVLTQEAGLDRLEEKYPAARKRLAAWTPRWDILRSALLLVAVACEIGAIASISHAVTGAGISAMWIQIVALFLLATLTLTFSQEIIPEALSESYADRLSMFFLLPAICFAIVLFPLAWPLARFSTRLQRRLLSGADEEAHPSTEDAIRSLVDQPNGHDLEEEEKEIIRSVFEFGETVTREIMTPRVDMEGVEDSDTIEHCVQRLKESGHSRFPVYHERLDDVRGLVHVKDMLKALSEGRQSQHILNIAGPVPFVPESMPINDLLQLLRSEHSQMALVVDEYGGTAGLVTVEDVLEELVGEIRDEYDDEEHTIHRLSDGSAIVNARMLVEDVNEQLDLHIPESDEYDSLGGYIFHALGRIPRPGDTLDVQDCTMTVQNATPRQIISVRIQSR